MKYWKDHVSLFFRQKNVKDLGNETFNQTFNKDTSLLQDEKCKLALAYKKYERVPEMDVAKTIEQDTKDEENLRTIDKIKREAAERKHHETAIRKYEESQITNVVELYFEQVLSNEQEALEQKEERFRLKQLYKNDVNRGDRIDVSNDRIRGDFIEEVKVPEKPLTSQKEIQEKKEANERPEFKKEKQELRTKLENEKQFITNLHKMVREDGELTNDPEKLFRAYN